MFWGELYLLLTVLVVVAASWWSRPFLLAAHALLVWCLAAKLIYVRGQIEDAATVLAAASWIGFVWFYVVARTHHTIGYMLVVYGVLFMLWGGVQFYTPWADAYTFKFVRNLIYLMMLVTVTAAGVGDALGNRRYRRGGSDNRRPGGVH